MRGRRRSLVGLGIVAVLLAVSLITITALGLGRSARRGSSGSPDEVVVDFYTWYIHSLVDEDGDWRGSPLRDGSLRESAYVTGRLVEDVEATLASFGEAGGYDPILIAQDIPATFVVLETRTRGDHATVLLETSFPGHRLQVDLIRGEGAWRIDHIAWAEAP